MPLPTTNLTAHYNASDNSNFFSTINGGGAGVHTGTVTDGQTPAVWDEEAGVSDQCWTWTGVATELPPWRASGLMKSGLGEFEHETGTLDRWGLYDQTATTPQPCSHVLAAGGKTVAFVIYPEEVTVNDALPYENHTLISEASRNFGLFIRNDSGTIRIYWYNFDGSDDSVNLPISLDRTWIVIARHHGGNLNLMTIDDEGTKVEASATASGDTSTMTGTLFIGLAGVGSENYFGRESEFALYNAGLTGTDLTDLEDYFKDKWLDLVEEAQKVALARF